MKLMYLVLELTLAEGGTQSWVVDEGFEDWDCLATAAVLNEALEHSGYVAYCEEQDY